MKIQKCTSSQGAILFIKRILVIYIHIYSSCYYGVYETRLINLIKTTKRGVGGGGGGEGGGVEEGGGGGELGFKTFLQNYSQATMKQ